MTGLNRAVRRIAGTVAPLVLAEVVVAMPALVKGSFSTRRQTLRTVTAAD